MPGPVNVPGDYVEETSYGGRSITPVATSITAFVGRAARGPVETPVAIGSFGDFERVFGGLWDQSTLGFAVRDFFANGGTAAVLVRLYWPDAGRAKATLAVDTLTLEAATEGAWANHLSARVDHDADWPGAPAAGPAATTFHLTVRDDASGIVEVFRDLVVLPSSHPRHVRRVLLGSTLVRCVAVGAERPAATAPGTHVMVLGTDVGSDGQLLEAASFRAGRRPAGAGLYALDKADLVNLLVIPPYTADGNVDVGIVAAAAGYCESRRALLILDGRSEWDSVAKVEAAARTGFDSTLGTTSANAALYFPRVREVNPLHGNQVEDFGSAGAVAGVIARTDAQRGVWKAPAGMEATLAGVRELSASLTDQDSGELNPLGVNALREFRTNGAPVHVVWGARTLQGVDGSTSEWRYVPVRRLALFLEESLDRGLRWAAFEPNGEPLWTQIRVAVEDLLGGLFRQGAFRGTTPREAYFVRCDATTTTQAEIDRGVAVVEIGFAPLKPAEFVILRVEQVAGPPTSGGG